MKLLACLVLVLGIVGGISASSAIEVPKSEGVSSLVERVKQSRPTKRRAQQCYSNCIEGCFLWWFCEANCQCECYGRPKGCKMY
jgi:hypothetical protein